MVDTGHRLVCFSSLNDRRHLSHLNAVKEAEVTFLEYLRAVLVLVESSIAITSQA